MVLRKIKRNSYAPGPAMVLFKELPEVALDPLASLISTVLTDPAKLTLEDLEAHMVLLPKGDPHNLAMVRPIAMCRAFYKLVALLLSQRIGELLQTDSFLLPTNVGFTPHGETHQLVTMLQSLFDVRNAQANVAPCPHLHALLVDLSQAYDRVPWFALHATLRHLGFPETFLQWIQRLGARGSCRSPPRGPPLKTTPVGPERPLPTGG